MAALNDRINEIIAGRLVSLDLPWPTVSHATNAIQPGSLTLLCGDPGASKSFMLLQCLAFWFNQGYITSVYELEKDLEFHLFRLLTQKTGQPGLTNPSWIQYNPELAKELEQTHKDYLNEIEEYIFVRNHHRITRTHLLAWANEQADNGARVVMIDPITMLHNETNRPWEEDVAFASELGKLASEKKVSVILVSHPDKKAGRARPAMGLIAGGAAFTRFLDTVLWLEAHDERTGPVKNVGGTVPESYDRTLHLLKVRNGIGRGLRIAMRFETDCLSFTELGVIVKK